MAKEHKYYIRYEYRPEGRFSSLKATERMRCDCCDELAVYFEPMHRSIQNRGGQIFKKRPQMKFCLAHFREHVTSKYPKKHRPAMEAGE